MSIKKIAPESPATKKLVFWGVVIVIIGFALYLVKYIIKTYYMQEFCNGNGSLEKVLYAPEIVMVAIGIILIFLGRLNSVGNILVGVKK